MCRSILDLGGEMKRPLLIVRREFLREYTTQKQFFFKLFKSELLKRIWLKFNVKKYCVGYIMILFEYSREIIRSSSL